MSTLIPTPVTLEDLIDETALINLFNDGIETQLVSPRTKAVEPVTVQVTDDPLAPRVSEGVADANVLNTISDSAADFVTDGVAVGDTAVSKVSGESALITVVTDLNNVITGTTDLLPLGTEGYFIIAAADVAASFWTQRDFGGEWVRSDTRTGNDEGAAYVLPVDTNAVVVHGIVYPIALASIGTYPPIG